MSSSTTTDVLCLSPHTDDAEIAIGGFLACLADRGRKVWLCDLTRGELGSNGTPDQRWREAAEASAILGVTGRLQLELPDGFISVHDRRQVLAAAAVIRLLRPRWVIAAPSPHRHPDHLAIGDLVAKAVFMARLSALPVEMPACLAWPQPPAITGSLEPWICEAVFTVTPPGGTPSLYIDTTRVQARKTAALACYASQFKAGDDRRPTMINDPGFLEEIQRRSREWGRRAGVGYAEALSSPTAPVLTDQSVEAWR